MTPLRQRMIDAMTVRGMSVRTVETYTEAVSRMARHYHRSPDLLSPAQIEAYMLHLVKDRRLSHSTLNQLSSASRFLFGHRRRAHQSHQWPRGGVHGTRR